NLSARRSAGPRCPVTPAREIASVEAMINTALTASARPIACRRRGDATAPVTMAGELIVIRVVALAGVSALSNCAGITTGAHLGSRPIHAALPVVRPVRFAEVVKPLLERSRAKVGLPIGLPPKRLYLKQRLVAVEADRSIRR